MAKELAVFARDLKNGKLSSKIVEKGVLHVDKLGASVPEGASELTL